MDERKDAVCQPVVKENDYNVKGERKEQDVRYRGSTVKENNGVNNLVEKHNHDDYPDKEFPCEI